MEGVINYLIGSMHSGSKIFMRTLINNQLI